MAVPFRGSFSAFIFALTAILVAAQANPAAAESGVATLLHAPNTCVAGHRFEPVPILEGHNRQPTVREFQARMQELRELAQGDASRCAGSPVGDEAITQPLSAD
jgi:hypothetical protein